MFVRLKIEDSREGLGATISQRDNDGKITGRPSIFLVGVKEEAKQRAKAVARALGLNTYGVVDKTSSRAVIHSRVLGSRDGPATAHPRSSNRARSRVTPNSRDALPASPPPSS